MKILNKCIGYLEKHRDLSPVQDDLTISELYGKVPSRLG